VRALSTRLAERDPGFERLRAKLHGDPEPADAERVLDYAANHAPEALWQDYVDLSQAVDALFAPPPLTGRLRHLARRVRRADLRRSLLTGAELLDSEPDPAGRLRESGRLLAVLREALPRLAGAARRREALDLSLALEQAAFAAGSELLRARPAATRAERLDWLRQLGWALYGSGLLSRREWQALQDSLARLHGPAVDLATYRRELRYLNRVPGWAGRWLAFHFQLAIDRLAAIEPRVRDFIPARLRGSPLLIYGRLLDGLLRDAGALAGVRHRLFGQAVGAGLRALNPGLARGVLHAAPPAPGAAWDRNGIYLLPETTADLPPVAGILTRGEGNALSHVQLLAANLGIPNVVVDDALLPALRRHAGERVVLAVSPGGVVRLARDGPDWDAVFGSARRPAVRLSPDLSRLDLARRDFPRLSQLRARDAGRIVGPKAANLGELKHHYPDAVTEGLVIPFGHFRALLERPIAPGGPSVFDWMRGEYRRLAGLRGAERTRQTRAFLCRLRDWIRQAPPDPAFRAGLARALRDTFGPDGSYAVFVRSDTNVEDLPGFTGAGLNLTVPNVVGLEAILRAIHRVWASPFTERAYAWRQARMDHPEAVYPSVLLLRSVPVDKSGVMVTLDTTTGATGYATVAVNHGVGGAVAGQAAEELLLDLRGGAVRLLADATAPRQRRLDPLGGLRELPAPPTGRVLASDEIARLRWLAGDLPRRFPQHDAAGRPTAADVEFGFRDGQLVLFQIRPYLRSRRARSNRYLLSLDRELAGSAGRPVALDEAPGGGGERIEHAG